MSHSLTINSMKTLPIALLTFAISLPSHAAPVTINSPDGKLTATISDEQGKLSYQIHMDGKQVLSPSKIGIRSNDFDYGSGAALGKASMRVINESYSMFGGKSKAVNQAREASIPITSSSESYFLDVHVANDGVGVRLRLPAKADRKISEDLCSWSLPDDPPLWLCGKNVYEETYTASILSKISNEPHGLPITAKVGDAYLCFSQAAFKDYGDILVRKNAAGALEGSFYADKNGWTTSSEVIQPWRVTIVARNLDALVNSTLVANLNPPPSPSLAKAEWIKPGRSSWQWMAIGAPKFEDQNQWVDWTKELGYEYYLVDEGWEQWPEKWKGLTTVCNYAKKQGVKVWLWVHSKELKTHEARMEYFKQSVKAGVVGVKIDFPDATDRWWSNWYYETAADAAEHKLLVDYHGAMVTSGMERTWPNVLTREAVRGHEWHITRYHRVLEPQHDVILPFTRYVTGPGDYTPTVFDPRELQGNTWAHELAQLYTFTSPFLCTGGHPKDYISNPAKDFMMAVPATWDETRVLAGSEIGKVSLLARRAGKEWFVVAMSGADAETLNIPLDFLGKGEWKMTRIGDNPEKADSYDRATEIVTSGKSITAKLSPRGGFIARFQKN
jgi:alpha-glucosidase